MSVDISDREKTYSMMKPTNCTITLIALLLALLILLPVLTNLAISTLDNYSFEDDASWLIVNSPSPWRGNHVHEMPAGLILGMSVFVLSVIYLGGRFSHKRFNDRIIESGNFSGGISIFLKTARQRAVFNFIFPDAQTYIKNQPQLNPIVMPILFPFLRRYFP